MTPLPMTNSLTPIDTSQSCMHDDPTGETERTKGGRSCCGGYTQRKNYSRDQADRGGAIERGFVAAGCYQPRRRFGG